MSTIAVLDQQTIDKIAAGEVIERPSSVVKELVENSIDAGATAVTVEIKEGGISFLRVTDNGGGIDAAQVPLAFLRHSTSKIRKAEDLLQVSSLGFRGEALSSIAAISMVELITKTPEADAGTRYVIEGGNEKKLEEIAAPDGTTFLVRSLFYNTPARRKFLKTPMTEAGYISDLLGRLALSHPEISFQFINNGQTKLHTSGNHNLKDVIYHIYGREVAANLAELRSQQSAVQMTGFIGKPLISRGNRSFENYFINGRYVKSSLISKAIEDAYHGFLMQHKYPFTVLHFTIDSNLLDVNVHPTKMELRFANQQEVYAQVLKAVRDSLTGRDLIPEVTLDEPKKPEPEKPEPEKSPQPQEPAKSQQTVMPQEAETPREHNLAYFMEQMKRRVTKEFETAKEPPKKAEVTKKPEAPRKAEAPGKQEPLKEKSEDITSNRELEVLVQANQVKEEAAYGEQKSVTEELKQLELFESHLLNPATKSEIQIIGQLFETYWLVQFEDKFYMIDQHAAHEKVLYERTVRDLKNKEITSQMVSPPLILTLTMQEAERLSEFLPSFEELGFEIEPFGGKEYALSAVPGNLFGIAEKTLFLEILDDLEHVGGRNSQLILERIASMSCKAAVKGSHKMSAAEAKALIEELFTLENPYHCPHGRPTIISMTKQEIEKKFKRIV